MVQEVEPGAELIRAMVAMMVDTPEAIEIDHELEGDVCIVTVNVATDDIGKVIGKNGRTAKSLRVILGAVGSKRGLRYNLQINDPNKATIQIRPRSK